MQPQLSFLRRHSARWACGLALGLSTVGLTAGSSSQQSCPTCVLDYPYASTNARTSLVFSESEIMRAFSTSVAGRHDTIKVWYNDEHALALGVRRVIVTTSKGKTTNDYPVTTLTNNPGAAIHPLVGATALSGDQAGTDISDRPMFPALFITDITTNVNSKAGDWQFGGTPIGPHAVFGTWKSVVRKVDKTKSPAVVTISTDNDPAPNHWNLGGGDAVPIPALDEGFGAEIRWNVDELGLLAGHNYRLYFMMHDGDQLKSGGDVGHACLNVTVIHRPPVANSDAYSVNEDAALTAIASGVLANDINVDGDHLTAILVSGPSHGTLTLNPDGSFRYLGATNYNGADSFTYRASDGETQSSVTTVTIAVNAVNDPPSFTKGPNQLVNEDAGPQTVANWATNLSAGPPDEASQALTFIVKTDTNALFSVQPAISPTGTLSYTPAPHVYGIAHVTVVLKDNGGTVNGGVDSSAPLTFTLTVNAPPAVSIVQPANNTVFIAPANITIIADAHDPDGTVSQVQILQGPNVLLQTNLAPYIRVWTNVPAGSYQFTAKATDNVGASTVSTPVNVTVLERPPILIVQPPHFNPQSGLFEELVRVLNPTPRSLSAVRVFVRGLAAGMQVFNASGKIGGVSYVQSKLPIPPGGSVDLTLEYYVPNFVTPNPALTAEMAEPFLQAASLSNTVVPVTRQIRLENGDFLVEFNSEAGRIYFVQYGNDLTDWKTAWPSVAGTGNRIQWMDNGPPRTETSPAPEPSRFYRIVLAP